MPQVGVSASSVTEVKGAVLALKAVDRDVRNNINRETRRILAPVWKEELASKLAGMPAVDQRILGKGARVKAGNPISLKAATSTKPLSGGLVPNLSGKAWEFGTSNREATTRYRRRNTRNPGSHTVVRRTMRHLPRREPNGRAIWPAAAEVAPRLTSLWVQTIVRVIHEKTEGTA